MILRKPIAATAVYCTSSPLPISPLLSPHPRHATNKPFPRCLNSCQSYHHRRSYASHNSNNNRPPPDDANLPPWPSSRNPSPYDIFAIARSDPYTKKRFYQLVKIYHPDLGHCSHPLCASLSPAARLERYRLVVAANDLLSDPAKRRTYDAYGIGWVHSPGVSSLRDMDRSWRHQPGSPAANATWEDWERWHEAKGEGQKGASQGPVYMPNGVFAMLMAMTCIIGAMLQEQRAEASGAHFLEAKNQHDRAVGEIVRRSTEETAGLSKDERVGRFLRDRENVAFQFLPGKYEEHSADTRNGPS
ncbi:J domain-containing protein-like protein [Hapsidospora chrysogenum ATCC 11550]|uniref:J domain-containing protein-like protein n=1 Tax=Hapsidospora chrysogenum (strain ATCC 11550 / CBS 779.69 / DSM 880 / IAM 14645 / JCM 23072 / IMI 49137) TaxID=857340 RepID=A0A086TG15_HAPC1|nr:J domain-containing protein-like protein [Hapsidospora chrysogenum ATCC 11550]